jgi:peptidoglycan/LPS O-acetylase OafA/YrhL
MNFLKQLQILRGLSAFMVALGHSKVIFWVGGQEYIQKYPVKDWGFLEYFYFGLDMLSSSAQEFVIVFFVLSGFLLNYSFKRNNWTYYGFIENRFIRIFPPYFFSVLLALGGLSFLGFIAPDLFLNETTSKIIIRIKAAYSELGVIPFVRALIFLPTHDYFACNFSYWSLIHEWIFYLILPFIRNKITWFLIASLALFFLSFNTDIKENQFFLIFIFRYSFSFFAGYFFFDYLQESKIRNFFSKKLLTFAIVIFLFFGTIFSGIAIESKYLLNLLFSVTFALVSIIALTNFELKNNPLVRLFYLLGDISYSLYLCHLPVYFFCYGILIYITDKFLFYERYYPIFVIIAIVFSYFFYLLIEKKALQIINNKRVKSH